MIGKEAVGRLDAHAGHAAFANQLGRGARAGDTAAPLDLGVLAKGALDLELRP